jgi:(p)ppGpp synthase/HD superfamily hydrolase
LGFLVFCLLVKIADRENNLETLRSLKPGKQVRMAFETQAIFSPLRKILKYKEDLSIIETEKLYQEHLICLTIIQTS